MAENQNPTEYRQALVTLRRHFYQHHTPGELMDFFMGLRGPVDDAGKEAIAKLLFGENATVESAMERIRPREK